MKHSLGKRIICVILVALMVIPTMLGVVQPSSVQAAEQSEDTSSVTPLVVSNKKKDTAVSEESASVQGIEILVNGKPTESLELFEHERQEITASGVEGAASYQWQIFAGEMNDWVDIYEANSETLAVSKALVGELMDDEGCAALRCRATSGSVEYLSEKFQVRMKEKEDVGINDTAFVAEVEAEPIEIYEETPEFVTVKIEYVRWEYRFSIDANDYVLTNMGPAFSPYIATILYNGSLETTVDNPTIVGFEGYLEEATTPCTSVDINLANVTSDITYTVNYKPKKVDYEVHYLFQNIYDDLYVEDTSVILKAQGTAGLPPKEGMSETFSGFTNLFYQPDTIAADGSTVFEVYYERNYYLMEFDCNGGYGANTLYVRYGTYVSVPTPIRTGYVFQGWDLVQTKDDVGNATEYPGVSAADLPETMPMCHSMYKAIWNTNNSPYKVVYWLENLNGGTYSYWGEKSLAGVSGTELVPSVVGTNNPADEDVNEDYLYCEYDLEATKAKNTVEGVADSKVIIEGDGSTIVNVYYSRKVFEIRYIYARRRLNNNGTETGEYYVANKTGNGIVPGTAAGSTMSTMEWNTPAGNTLPSIKTDYDSKYDSKSEDIAGYRYFYIAVRAAYGADIEDVWPAAAFEDTTKGSRWGSWAAEKGTPYRTEYGDSHANIVGPYPYMSSEMIKESDADDKLTDESTGEEYYLAQRMVAWWGGNTIGNHSYHIYIESLDGTDFDFKYNGKKYKLEKTLTFTCAHNDKTRVDPFYYTGYTCINNTKGQRNDTQANSNNYEGDKNKPIESCPNNNNCGYCNVFFYDCDSHDLKFYNYNADYGVTDKRKYGTSITNPGTPTYPAGVEPGAYEFTGWYTTADCYEGTEVDWTNITMPANNLTIYAKWEPVIRNVKFHLLYTDVGTTNYWQPDPAHPITYPIGVPHGELLGTAYNYIPTREGYTFIGWFYFDENGKKKFAPDSMAVVRDLELFAEWKSSIPTTYQVKYEAWRKGEGNESELVDAEIALTNEGYSTAGKTITFLAKGGAQLYNKSGEGKHNYQTKWFPESASHSILMDSDGQNNTYTFKYYHKDYINYQIIYKDRITGVELDRSEVIRTENAIVTAKYKPIEGMIPEEFYIERSIAYDSTDYTKQGNENHVEPANIIYFYYLPDEEHAPFLVEHFQQLPDGTYSLAQTEQGIADIGTTVAATAKTFTGYTFIASQSEVITQVQDSNSETGWKDQVETGIMSGVISLGGVHIKLYYNLNAYPYTVRYLEYGTDKKLLPDKVVEGSKFGTTVSEVAETIIDVTEDDVTTTYEYYLGVSATKLERTKTITIRANEESNVITFYYNQKKIPVEYHVVCKSETLATLNKVSLGSESAAVASNLAGSNAMKGTGFVFKGWYYDEECTLPVPDKWVSIPEGGTENTYLKPKIMEEDADGKEHFYALFEPIYSGMKITNNGVSTEDQSDHRFLYRIQGKAGTVTQDIDLTVSIVGNGFKVITNLPIGDYTVTELESWSWDYDCDKYAKAVTVEQEKNANVTFTNVEKAVYWLIGEVSKVNNYN